MIEAYIIAGRRNVMVDQELLSAISDLLDEKLDEKLEEKLEAKFEEKLRPIRQDIDELKADNKLIHIKLDSLESDVKKNSLILENEVLPRLQTIEQCYVESSRIFMQKSEQIDRIQSDNDVMKIVIQEHSESLEKIS